MVSAEMPCPTPSAPSSGEPAVAVPGAQHILGCGFVDDHTLGAKGAPCEPTIVAPLSPREKLRSAIGFVVTESEADQPIAWALRLIELKQAWEAFEADVPPTPEEDTEAHWIASGLAQWVRAPEEGSDGLDVLAGRALMLVDRITTRGGV